MQIRYGVAAAAVVAAMVGGQAFAEQPTSAYLGIGGGAVFLPNIERDLGGKVESDTGWVGAGTLGLRWANGWRGELEGAHRENDGKAGGIGGTTKSSSILVNVLRDFDIGSKVTPYLGLGVGAARVNYDFPIAASKKRDTGFMYQAIVGLSVPFTEKLEGFADYHYFGTASLQNTIAGSGLDDYAGHELMAGIRWTFWQAEKTVAAAPAPAPMAAPKDYVIYFEFDKAKITSAAGAVLDELKSTSGGQAVSVTGHTDTVGSSAYNQKLSDRRAGSTAKALETRGVKVDSVTGKGFSEPAVQTGPGVKEPLNRRAVIKLDGPAAPSQ